MPIYGPSEITHLSRDGCQHSFVADKDRYPLPIASDPDRSLPMLECNKGCMEWGLEPRNGWKNRPEQVKLTQQEVENELINSKDTRGGLQELMAEAMGEAMRRQVALSEGVDVRQAPTRARRTR